MWVRCPSVTKRLCGLKRPFEPEVMNTLVSKWPSGPGESLCRLQSSLWAGNVESLGGQDDVCCQEDKSLCGFGGPF